MLSKSFSATRVCLANMADGVPRNCRSKVGDSGKVHDPWKMYLGLVLFGCLVAKLQGVFLLKKKDPIPSMYGIFTYIYHKFRPNVGKYTIHGWYGDVLTLVIFKVWHSTEWQGRLRGYSCQLERMVVMWGFCSSRSYCFQKMQFFLPRLVLSFRQGRLGRPCSDSALLYYDKLCCICIDISCAWVQLLMDGSFGY